MESSGENIQNNRIDQNNLISSLLKVLSENDTFKSEIQDKNAEIQKITQEKDSKIRELRDKFKREYSAMAGLCGQLMESETRAYSAMTDLYEQLMESENREKNLKQRLIKANNDVFNKSYENPPRKRSRSVREEEIQRELNSNKLRHIISNNNETIAEYKSKQEALEAENKGLESLLNDTTTELRKIQNLQTENENAHRKEKETLKAENQELKKARETLESEIRKLKRKLDKANQEVNNLKKQRTEKPKNFKVFEGETLNTIENLGIDVSKYEAFPSLNKLVIKSNEVSDILRNKPDLSKLTILDIYDCDEKPLQITELSELLHLARNIEGLDLSSCNLTFLPEEIGNLKNLRKLNLSYNNLTSLPKGMGNLTKLENLYLRKNQLTELPAEIYALSELKGLDIRNNPLEKLSRGMFVFSNTKIHQ